MVLKRSFPPKAVPLIAVFLFLLGYLLYAEVLEEGLEGYLEYKQKVRYRIIPFLW